MMAVLQFQICVGDEGKTASRQTAMAMSVSGELKRGCPCNRPSPRSSHHEDWGEAMSSPANGIGALALL